MWLYSETGDMATLRTFQRGALYLAIFTFVIWTVVTLSGADRLPLVSLSLSMDGLVGFIVFFLFAVLLSIAALVQEYLRSRDEDSSPG